MKVVVKHLKETDFLIGLQDGQGTRIADLECNAVTLVKPEDQFRIVMEQNGDYIGTVYGIREISFEGDFSVETEDESA